MSESKEKFTPKVGEDVYVKARVTYIGGNGQPEVAWRNHDGDELLYTPFTSTVIPASELQLNEQPDAEVQEEIERFSKWIECMMIRIKKGSVVSLYDSEMKLRVIALLKSLPKQEARNYMEVSDNILDDFPSLEDYICDIMASLVNQGIVEKYNPQPTEADLLSKAKELPGGIAQALEAIEKMKGE